MIIQQCWTVTEAIKALQRERKPDDVIIFDGDMHYVKIQKEKPRYVIVGTYI